MLERHPRARACCGSSCCPIACRSRSQNREGQLVGMDVEMARALATDLEVRRPVLSDRPDAAGRACSQPGAGDIAMSGVVVTPDRAVGHAVFDALSRRNPGVRDPRSAARSLPDLGRHPPAGCRPRRRARRSRVPARRRRARSGRCSSCRCGSRTEFLTGRDEVMAYVLPAERGSVLTLLHPAYSVVVPQPDTIKLPIAYPVARGDERWVTFVNTWLELKRRDGTIDALYRHWILGEHAAPSEAAMVGRAQRAALGGVERRRASTNPKLQTQVSRHSSCHIPSATPPCSRPRVGRRLADVCFGLGRWAAWDLELGAWDLTSSVLQTPADSAARHAEGLLHVLDIGPGVGDDVAWSASRSRGHTSRDSRCRRTPAPCAAIRSGRRRSPAACSRS